MLLMFFSVLLDGRTALIPVDGQMEVLPSLHEARRSDKISSESQLREALMLIDEIIDLLSSRDGSLAGALMKTKVFLHSIGKKEPLAWVNQELNGYAKGETIPPYRYLKATVLANFANIAWQVKSHPIPIGHLTKEEQQSLTKLRFSNPISMLEELASKGSAGVPIPLELNYRLGEQLGSGFEIQRAWSEVSGPELKAALTQVRSRLLDFLLEVKELVDRI